MENDCTKVKASMGVAVAVLVAASIFGNIKTATLALRVVVQGTVFGYGLHEGYKQQGFIGIFLSILVITGGIYGFYLISVDEKAFITLSYLTLVGTGLFGLRVQDISELST